MHSATYSLTIGTLAVFAAGWFVVKGYNAKGILFGIGLVLLAIALASGYPIIDAPSGHPVSDICNYLYDLFKERGGGLGMLIMIFVGFSAYMSHVGANDVVIRILYKPLRYVNSPYAVMSGGFLLGALMSIAINSATALGLFLMATLFPIMTRLGISVPSAAAICSSTMMVNLSLTAADVIYASEKANMDIIGFAVKTLMPMSFIALLCAAIAHFYWQRYCDRREGLLQNTGGAEAAIDTAEAAALKTDAPTGYAILPFLPIIGLFIFDGTIAAEISLGGLVILTVLITALLEYARARSAEKAYEGLEVLYLGMAEGFSGVVMLLIAAGVFAHGLESIGFVNALITAAQGIGTGVNLIMLILVVVTLLVTIATGSGNAAFFAFVELVPKLAGQMGFNPVYLIAPMMQISNTGYSLSPVSGVMVAVSGAAKISPLLLVKRNSVPSLTAATVVVIYTMLILPK